MKLGPVPVDFSRLRRPRAHMVLVAAAGPGVNLVLAFAAAAAGHLIGFLPERLGEWSAQMLENAIVLNLVLAVFNMLPLPPLDGGRVATGLLPIGLARPLARLEPYGMLIVVGLMFLLPMIGAALSLNLNIFTTLIGPLVDLLYILVVTLAGSG